MTNKTQKNTFFPGDAHAEGAKRVFNVKWVSLFPTRLRAEAVLSRCLSRVKLITGGVTAQQTAATTADPLHTQQHTQKKKKKAGGL